MIPDEDGNLPIHISCTTSGLDTLKIWHEKGWDFNIENSQGKSCLFLCCRYDHPGSIQFLESITLDILRPNKHGVHPLEYCVTRGSFSCFDYLLSFRLKKLPNELLDVDKILLNQFG